MFAKDKVIDKTITTENFTENWEKMSQKMVEMKQKKILQKIVPFVGNAIFFYLICIVTVGLIYRLNVAELNMIVDKLSCFTKPWKMLAPMLEHPTWHWVAQGICLILPIYAVVMIVSVLITVLVRSIYKPTSGKTLTGDIAVDSKEFYLMAKETSVRTFHAQVTTSVLFGFIYLLGILALIVAVFMHMIEINDYSLYEKLLIDFITWYCSIVGEKFAMTAGVVMDFVLKMGLPMIGIVYSAINLGVSYLMKLLYNAKFDEDTVAEAQKFYYECNPQIKAQIEEEDAIISQAAEIKKRRIAEEKEFVEEVNKKNPIWKKIKIGLSVGFVLIILGFGGWISSKVDFKELLQYVDFDSIEQGFDGIFDSTEGTEGTESTEVPEGEEG